MSRRNESGGPRGKYLLVLSLGALGVVYGDIGTSPLYAIRECFFGEYAVAVTRANVLGVLSLIVWALILVISIKYLTFILRADNRGEGGILALMALVHPEHAARHREHSARHAGADRSTGAGRWVLGALGLFGAALLYGDGMITPAISVLSAIEGLEVATPVFEPYVIPITIAILIGLFLFQRRGTAGIGAVFGPVTLVWFVVLAALGVHGVAQQPDVLVAVNPLHGLRFLARNELQGFFVLGAVVLVVTGGEALYADMGHFGTRPIRLTWFLVVLPALLLNYFGQGALLLGDPDVAHNPFFRLAPAWALYPMVLLATAAACIASQAVISGAFSLTMQAVQLGYSPRLEIEHTSAREIGQIYMPKVNGALMVATIALVIGFRSSSNLAAAYGVAVTTTMVLTTLLFYVVARQVWGWNRLLVGGLVLAFLVADLSLFGASIVKIGHGGWFPLAVAAIVITLLSTWRRGRKILAQRLRAGAIPVEQFLDGLRTHPPARVSGTAIFMTASPEGVPLALLHNLKHNKMLHERVALLTVATEEIPRVPTEERIDVERLGSGFYRIIAHYGFMEDPHIAEVIARLVDEGLKTEMAETTFFLGREHLIASRKRPGMAVWREQLFAFMSRNAQQATEYFHIPRGRVVEVGAQIEL